MGLLNAAVWFGAAVGFTFCVNPAASSAGMNELLGAKNYPFFSVAIAQLFAARYCYLCLVCGGLAVLHLLAEWLYFGRYPRRFWLGLLAGLLAIGLFQCCWLQPRLADLNRRQFGRPELRQTAARSFRMWHHVSTALNLVMVSGLALYFWRVANPPDPARFVSAAKFRY
jgi:hypothetical protein